VKRVWSVSGVALVALALLAWVSERRMASPARRMLVPEGRRAYHGMHPEIVAARIREFAATLERPLP